MYFTPDELRAHGHDAEKLAAARQARLKADYEQGWPGVYAIDCATCGTRFYAQSPFALFCSTRCNNADQYARRKRHPHQVTCDQCGQPFTAKRTDARLCGPRCRQAARRAALKIAAEQPPKATPRKCPLTRRAKRR